MPAPESSVSVHSTALTPSHENDGTRAINAHSQPSDLSLDEVKALTDTSRISALLKQLNQHEQRVDHELDVLLGNKERLQRSMCSLMRLKCVRLGVWCLYTYAYAEVKPVACASVCVWLFLSPSVTCSLT
jgi:hypothetical protein